MRQALGGFLTLLGIVWALPITLFGMLLSVPVLAMRGHLTIVAGPTPAVVVSGRLADRMLARHPFGAMWAMAIGHVVIVTQHGLTPQILSHELAHVRQAACWGIFFPIAYLLASGWAVVRGKDAYWHNVFEVAARKAERHS